MLPRNFYWTNIKPLNPFTPEIAGKIEGGNFKTHITVISPVRGVNWGRQTTCPPTRLQMLYTFEYSLKNQVQVTNSGFSIPIN